MSHTDSHPSAHQHEGKQCPVTGKHGYCPAQPGDSRAPCPGLNTLANYGYINRDGKNVTAWQIHQGAKECFGLSTPLALLMAYGAFTLLMHVGPIDLYHIGRHNRVEHNASLVRHDTPSGEDYAPVEIDEGLVKDLINDARRSSSPGDAETDDQEVLINELDIARSRVRREKECHPMDSFHALVARAEISIILGVWETQGKDKVGVPGEWLREWFGQERLPEGWKPTHTQGVFNTARRASVIKRAMEEIRKAEASSSTANGDGESEDGEGASAASSTAK